MPKPFALFLVAVIVSVAGCKAEPPAAEPSPSPPETQSPQPAAEGPAPAAATPAQSGWQILFDGKTLDGWKVTDFAGHGQVEVKDGRMIFDLGAGDLTGVTWAGHTVLVETGPVWARMGGDLPRMNYGVEIEAMRIEGEDFFCGLTFPVGDSCCSLIVGGWGGQVVGLSSFDGQDAANNETARTKVFEKNRWYRILLKVSDNRIEAWIDGEKLVDARPGGRKVSVRSEVELSQPFGLASWRTKAAVRLVRLRRF
jgi:hypothetical protein